jgi:maltose alpha-D-glucosyltransferase/alpha-amylase
MSPQVHAAGGRRRSKKALESDPLWYRDAVIYELRVGAFQDSDGDGIGDFRGLTERLDYLRELGVTALWLLPFYPSPRRDDGYDISDYDAVHADSGTLEDFRVFLREAHRRDLRVITELVINHTSDQHPWFQRARRAPPGSRWRNFYVWSDTAREYSDARIIFKDFEHSNWSWDPVAKAYYWHRFYSHQPDLNFESPDVRREVLRALDFWFSMGVDGMRLDAIPYLCEREGTNCENLPETHAILKDLRKHVDARYRDRMLLAEANQWPEDAVAYFGQGDECHMSFHFPVMPRLFMALHMEDRYPIIDILAQTPQIPENCQWALFLRNHDELTLEMVTDEERDYMYRVYAHDARARINLGIRRRLAPLLGNDRRRIELLNALLLSLPGTPVVYYGDEIGMGDNIYLGDRNGVRTPMQWSPDRNAGFSRANPQQLYLPVVIDPEYNYETVNVEAQGQNPHSLLHWMKRIIGLRKRYRAFGRGSIEFLHPNNRKVLAFIRSWEDEQILVVVNLSRFAEYVELDLSAYRGQVAVELFGGRPFPPIGDLPYLMTLGPHSFYWFRLEEPLEGEALGAQAAPGRLPRVRRAGSFEQTLRASGREELERILPEVLRGRRWFGGKDQPIESVRIVDTVRGPVEGSLIVFAEVLQAGGSSTYALPLSFAQGSEMEVVRHEHPAAPLFELENDEGALEGIAWDALEDPAFCAGLLDAIGRRRKLRGSAGELVGSRTRAFAALRGADDTALPASLLRSEQSNSSVCYGDRLILKLFRRLAEGVNPDLEIGRFLTERARFGHTAKVAGALEYRTGRGAPTTLAILHQQIENEGDAWRYTLDEIERAFEEALARHPGGVPDPAPGLGDLLEAARAEPPEIAEELVGGYLESARLLGQRTAELHLALASDRDDPSFAPEPFTTLYQRSLYQSMRTQTIRTFELLRERRGSMSGPALAEIDSVLALEGRLLEAFQTLIGAPLGGVRLRCHGDYHLGQVLYTGNDFSIIDFEGEPARTLSERRLKRSPLRDVAGMLRSFDYAVSTALLTSGERGSIRPEDVAALEPWARIWRHSVSASFLSAYLDPVQAAGLIPTAHEPLGILLRSLLLDKAVYELRYELGNRPDWIRIPVRGIRGILEDHG